MESRARAASYAVSAACSSKRFRAESPRATRADAATVPGASCATRRVARGPAARASRNQGRMHGLQGGGNEARMLVSALIERKRDGDELAPGEWREVVSSYVAGRVPDYQMSALLMAVVWRGLTPEELRA